MAKTKTAERVTRPQGLARNGFERFCIHAKRDWQLYLLIVAPVVYLFIFNYIPLAGIQMSFRDYRPKGGVWGSDWVGLNWFQKFLDDPDFLKIFWNTVVLSVYSLVVGFPLPILFALMLNAMPSKRYKRTVQTLSYMPHFISTTVAIGIIQLIFSPYNGLYGNVYRLLGNEGYPKDFRNLESTFRHIYVWSGVWQQLGWSSIIYMSALGSVSPDQHEAAEIDGASRIKRIFYIDLPAIAPTIMMLLIMRIGSLVGVGYEKAYLLQSPINLGTSEVISTYVFKHGMSSFRNFSYGTAVSLFNTVINWCLMFITNMITRKSTDGDVALF